jgi:hypothetical protein
MPSASFLFNITCIEARDIEKIFAMELLVAHGPK